MEPVPVRKGEIHIEDQTEAIWDTGIFTLGMINFLNRYSALSTLIHQAIDYKPGRVHQENFNQLKMEISNIKALPYFNANAETTLQMDASKKGLRACLIWKVS